jgi:hypothetical protein
MLEERKQTIPVAMARGRSLKCTFHINNIARLYDNPDLRHPQAGYQARREHQDSVADFATPGSFGDTFRPEYLNLRLRSLFICRFAP